MTRESLAQKDLPVFNNNDPYLNFRTFVFHAGSIPIPLNALL